MNIQFTNICNHVRMNESLYNKNNGFISFADVTKGGAAITLRDNTLYIEEATLFASDYDYLQRAIEIIFVLGYNHYKDIRVIEVDGDSFYNINKGESLFCTIHFTFENDIRQKHFDVLINNN